MIRPPPSSTLFPYTTLFRSCSTAAENQSLPESRVRCVGWAPIHRDRANSPDRARSEEHTFELQSLRHLVCRLLLEKKKIEYSVSLHVPVRPDYHAVMNMRPT